MTDPLDPLAGKDPYPRQQIDLLGLHRERAELLEEIVSTPGPGKPAPSTRAKVLLPIGIAAALAIVGGGVWFASSGDPSGGDDPVVAASTTPDVTEQDPADERSEQASPEQASPDEATPGEGDDVRVGGVRVGEVLSVKDCDHALRSRHAQLVMLRPRGTRELRHGQKHPTGIYYYAIRRDTERYLMVDQDCRVFALSNRHDLRIEELARLLQERSDRKRR